jgi:hypothetical protein
MFLSGHAVAQLVEAVYYKPEGRGFDSQFNKISTSYCETRLIFSSKISKQPSTYRTDSLCGDKHGHLLDFVQWGAKVYLLLVFVCEFVLCYYRISAFVCVCVCVCVLVQFIWPTYARPTSNVIHSNPLYCIRTGF